jgi:hypothetical protein
LAQIQAEPTNKRHVTTSTSKRHFIDYFNGLSADPKLIPSPEAFPKVLLLQPWLGYRVSLPFTEPISIISRTQIISSESKQDCNYQEPYGDYFSLAHFVCRGSAIIDLSSERF